MGLNVCPHCGAELVTEEMIAERMAAAAQSLLPDVVRIRYSLGEDEIGMAAIFVRLIFTDEACKSKMLQNFRKAQIQILKRVKPYDFGRLAYFNVRSVSEQAKLKEPEWE